MHPLKMYQITNGKIITFGPVITRFDLIRPTPTIVAPKLAPESSHLNGVWRPLIGDAGFGEVTVRESNTLRVDVDDDEEEIPLPRKPRPPSTPTKISNPIPKFAHSPMKSPYAYNNLTPMNSTHNNTPIRSPSTPNNNITPMKSTPNKFLNSTPSKFTPVTSSNNIFTKQNISPAKHSTNIFAPNQTSPSRVTSHSANMISRVESKREITLGFKNEIEGDDPTLSLDILNQIAATDSEPTAPPPQQSALSPLPSKNEKKVTKVLEQTEPTEDIDMGVVKKPTILQRETSSMVDDESDSDGFDEVVKETQPVEINVLGGSESQSTIDDVNGNDVNGNDENGKDGKENGGGKRNYQMDVVNIEGFVRDDAVSQQLDDVDISQGMLRNSSSDDEEEQEEQENGDGKEEEGENGEKSQEILVSEISGSVRSDIRVSVKNKGSRVLVDSEDESEEKVVGGGVEVVVDGRSVDADVEATR
ncbi:hypothetical protein HK098_005629 [Nowakowskiella sp. JEL0407]|nr:hypothetical protein HK098_005629 [Nowakowskiella sp. JEL0407]